MAGCADAGEAVHPGARRQVAPTWCSPTPTWPRRPPRRRTPSSTTPGQDCCARSRILVERSAYDEFLSLLEPAVSDLAVLDPSDRSSEMGPLISAQQKRTVQGFLADAEVAFTGSAPDNDGFWVPPTVVLSGSTDERIWREELFGPVVAVMPFDDEAHAVELANDTEYGLSGSIFTNDLGRGAAGRARHRVPATSASTRTPRCATGRRSAGSSSPASAASSDPTPRTRSPRRRTSSSPD